MKSGNTILIYRERRSVQILIPVPIKSLEYLPNNVKIETIATNLLILNSLTLLAISKSSIKKIWERKQY